MWPIQEQGSGKGIAHTLPTFLSKFNSICREHLEDKKAKAFAFIFYDFYDREFRKILKDQGVFVKLDRLAGTNLSIFFLNSGRREAIKRFNSEFLKRLQIADTVNTPCVVFFKLHKQQIVQMAVAELGSADLVHGFHELYEVIADYIESDTNHDEITPRYLRWIKGGTKFLSIEVFEALLKDVLDHIL